MSGFPISGSRHTYMRFISGQGGFLQLKLPDMHYNVINFFFRLAGKECSSMCAQLGACVLRMTIFCFHWLQIWNRPIDPERLHSITTALMLFILLSIGKYSYQSGLSQNQCYLFFVYECINSNLLLSNTNRLGKL